MSTMKNLLVTLVALTVFNTASDAQFKRVRRLPPQEPDKPLTAENLLKASACFAAAGVVLYPIITAKTDKKSNATL